jgi:hypothetical protein
MKRSIGILILLCAMAMQVFAIGGKCGEKVKWNFDKSTGVLTISGEGPMYDYANIVPWSKNREGIKRIVVEEGVTYIGKTAFNQCEQVTSITIPNSVTEIGSGAFMLCVSLPSIVLPEGVTSIGTSAFKACSSLKTFKIPNSVTQIENGLFQYCSKLEAIDIPEGVVSVGRRAFDDCKKLNSITIPNSLTSIGEDAFKECYGLKGVYITDLTAWCNIGYKTYNSNPLNFAHHLYLNNEEVFDLVIPDNVKFIQDYTFIGGESIKTVHLSDNVVSIGRWAFYGCKKLVSVNLPNSINQIGSLAFHGCTQLPTVIIPSGIKTIEYGTFANCDELNLVVVPENVTDVRSDAFDKCTKLRIYTTSSFEFWKVNVPASRVVKMTPVELAYYYPYSIFAEEYVENGINEWQKKGEFERTSDWQKRVTVQSRQQKIQTLVKEAEQKYIAFRLKQVNMTLNPMLGKYDADNEVFAIEDAKYGMMYLPVPLGDAQDFKTNWNQKKMLPQLQIMDDQIRIAALTITMPNGKQYIYRNTDAVSYNLAEAEYHFDPIELDLPNTSGPQGGQINIQRTTVQIGKSPVDTDIPVTNASNPQTFVIIFANEDYKNVSSVPFAKNDGSVFQKYCQKTLGIPVSNIHYVENASFNDMRIQLAWLKDVCDAFDGNASIIVYYAGHGIPDEASKSAYLLPVDGDGRYVQSAYNVDELYQKLGAMKAKSVTVFMDACFSGSKREQGMLASARGVALKAKAGIPQGNMVVFSAATGDETAYPDNDQQHGMFTYYLLKKLQETKGDVSLKDLGDYISTNVRQQSIVKNGKSQTPTVTSSATLGAEWQNWKLK